ncbi:FMN-binding negative transcriptional regulator [Luteimonas fraxinea]|uniref:FMN-binding negative transcriptional regulator n=1 Tax=Luteimonas fraxinea TaxID=2901869 RepID=A0ABS8UBP5_9GAMM|nr:FMN-binding negative transcriptional regulator [Luteimonas fraxinea]MCD9096913.1 FMN-binding negative transcriptional regulator [Luteimonas fraxinea]MCD9126772.1 FMN-binding negative transcriptional regulator [Luteimonas fraxinea]UHH09744.1 FMN-binding negative transcriptional regulator [Luteimonas fraxinea]
MYTPRAFAVDDLQSLDALFARDAFVTLVTTGPDGAPLASQLPVLYRREADMLHVEGHWARPNPQATHDGPALMIVHGPHAYVSPGWYPDKVEASRVPTWNYATAHLCGRLERFDDEAALADLVARTSDVFEARVGGDWRFEPEDDRQRRQLRGIVGFRFRVDAVEIKYKLSQNHPAANRSAVADALSAGDTNAREIAAMMRAIAS